MAFHDAFQVMRTGLPVPAQPEADMKVIELSRARFEQAMQAIACVCMAAWTVSIVLVELRVLA